MNEDVKLIVKELSVVSFLKEKSIHADQYYKENSYPATGNSSLARHMASELYFKKDCGIDIGDKIKFTFSDHTNGSSIPLQVEYTYQAQQYDDVSIVMKQIGSEVSNPKQ